MTLVSFLIERHLTFAIKELPAEKRAGKTFNSNHINSSLNLSTTKKTKGKFYEHTN